jgi:hypothetical protein
VDAATFIPGSTHTYALAAGSITARPLCPYFVLGECYHGEACAFVHGERCELCGLACLHPDDASQRAAHHRECLAEHEAACDEAFAEVISPQFAILKGRMDLWIAGAIARSAMRYLHGEDPRERRKIWDSSKLPSLLLSRLHSHMAQVATIREQDCPVSIHSSNPALCYLQIVSGMPHTQRLHHPGEALGGRAKRQDETNR